MIRKIIEINEEKCDGCGLCTQNCPEGAIQVIDGKARLINEVFCDGLGECIKSCPKGAITVIEKEAKPYDEIKVLKEKIIPAGENTIKAHLKHLKEHGAITYYNQAINYLKDIGLNIKIEENLNQNECCCPVISYQENNIISKDIKSDSKNIKLPHWPIQIKLVPPSAPFLKNKDIVIITDCSALAYPDIQKFFGQQKAILLGCPKLDNAYEYIEKLCLILKEASPKSIHIVRMVVPCCGGMVEIVKEAIKKSGIIIPFGYTVISINGEVLEQI